MGAPESGMEAAGQPTADTLLTAFRTIKDAERSRHAAVLDYWLSIRGDKEFPPLHDLDPLEISDAGPSSILFELIGGGQDAEVRHLGDGLADHVAEQRIIDAPTPSLLASIARKLPIVAISREFLAFEDNFTVADRLTRCWITLLPLSSCGSWVDYVYAFVSIETSGGKAAKTPPPTEEPAAEDVELIAEAAAEEPAAEDVEPVAEEAPAEAAIEQADGPAEEPEGEAEQLPEPVAEAEEDTDALDGAPPVVDEEADRPIEEMVDEDMPPAAATEMTDEIESNPEPSSMEAPADAPAAKSGPGFSKLIEGIANLTGFYGQGVRAESEVSVDLGSSEAASLEQPEEESQADDPVTVEQPMELEELALEQEANETDAADEPSDTPPREETTAQSNPPAPAMEGALQNKLSEVRALADEAREAQLRATAALHEGLSAAYDFALDAETSPEEYLRLVEAQGLKIQLRAPMAPVAKLAFDGVCDSATIKQFEAVLAWALKEELPRGELIERIKQAGGVSELLNGA